MDDLKDLQEEYSYGVPDLFVRVAISDIESKAKSCDPCGINVIPYPLSTGSDCGDPMYFSFYCDNSTGTLSFKTHNGTYNVTTINQDTRTFVIQEKDVDDCNASTRGQIRKFNTSFPFKVNASKRWCHTVAGNFISNVSSQGLVEIDIGWEPPPEPVCSSSSDCDDWPNSTCNVTGNGTARCLCNSIFLWDGKALNCVHVVDGQAGGSSRKKKPLSLIVGGTIASVIVLSSFFMRKEAKRRESQQNTERNAAAWRLWREDKALDLMDETLREICNTNEFLRCVNVALLCVQDDPSDRPTMSNVVVMLSSEAANLPVPKNPAFFIRRGLSGTASCSSKQGTGLFSTASSSMMHSWLMVRRGRNQRDLCAMHSMLSTVFFSYAFLLCSSLLCCFARDTITYAGSLISNDGGETLVSAGKRFELGFFAPEQSSAYRSYVGIWYYRSNPRIYVWVANRNRPLLDDGAVLALEEERDEFVISDGSIKHWTSGESSDFFRPERMPDVIEYFLSNFTRGFESISVSNPTIILNGINISLSDFSNTRIRLDVNGELQYWSYNTNWSKLWWEPKDKCSVYNACGNFGSCNLYNKVACRCLPGFKPQSLENWNKKDFSSGCSRSSDACGKKDTFLSLKTMKFGQTDLSFMTADEKQCRDECLRNCQCQAHSFVKGEVNLRREKRLRNNTCFIWDDLKDLQEEYSYGGPDLFVRVAISDIEPKAKSCEPCGINVIPYPLSTGSDCGDPMYFSFYCDNSTGRLSFKTHNGTYNVTTINQDTRTFVIQEKDVDACNASTRGQIRKFNTSFPFKMNASKRWCDTVAGNFISNVSSQGLVEIDIGWEPPPEPVCSSSLDCDDWSNSTCNVTGNGTARCLCNSNFLWDGKALNCVHGGSSRKKKPLSLIVGGTIASVIVLSSIFLYICIFMRKEAKRRESQQNTERNAAAWRLWREDKALDLMDETLREICNTNEFLRCVNVALLCVQDDPSDRPTMSNVVVMLSSEAANLPVPKNPAFFIRRGLSGTASCSSKQGTGLCSTASSSSKQEINIDTTIASDEDNFLSICIKSWKVSQSLNGKATLTLFEHHNPYRVPMVLTVYHQIIPNISLRRQSII
ncbi:LOW QUALITY PROTEIN: hypothetical protein NC651_040517 [Populus alba x Populus x berolinensis]|nr:LOW QUALITY PROTEIN: hypothetical protein NC651_040517 [Populus alba x Populus x berolinensis]